MHSRIPSRVIAATLELALLAGSFSPAAATPLTYGDLSALLELAPNSISQETNQQIVSEDREPSPTSSTSSSEDIQIISSTSKSSSKSKSNSIFRSSFSFAPKSTSRYSSSSSSIETTECTYNATQDHQSSGQSSGLFACIAGFETDSWESENCGGQHFYKGRNSFWYGSEEDGVEGAKECYRECEGCLMDAVVDGASKVECRVTRGVMDVSRCWVGIE